MNIIMIAINARRNLYVQLALGAENGPIVDEANWTFFGLFDRLQGEQKSCVFFPQNAGFAQISEPGSKID